MDVSKMEQLRKEMQQLSNGKTVNEISEEEAEEFNCQGVEAAKKGAFVKASKLFETAAMAGNIDAMSNLGILYENGEGIAKNLQESFRWYKKAAEHGHIEAMWKVAHNYVDNEDMTQAFGWIKRLAEIGEVNAMDWLGDLYRDGRGVMENASEAAKWYQKAVNKGNIYSMVSLGFLYARGVGVEANDDMAIKLLEKAIKTAQKFGDSGDVAKMAEQMRYLGDFFKRLNESLAHEEIERGELVSEETHEIYKKYLDCYVKADEAGDKIAHQEREKWGDLCFITTAVCTSFGKPDDCYELTMFRDFRDGWLRQQSDGESLIAQYYQTAPSIVEHIDLLPNAQEIYRGIWDKYLRPCLKCLEKAQYQSCKQLYIKMVESLEKLYG